MKARLTTLKVILPLLILLSGVELIGQRSAMITDTNTEYDKRQLPSLTLSLDAAVESVYEPWQDFWEDRYDIDIDRTDKDRNAIAYLAEQVNLAGISPKNLDLYSSVDGTDRVSTVSMSLAFTETEVVTSRSPAATYMAAKAILEEFRTYFYTSYFDTRISEMRDELGDIRDDGQGASKDAKKARSKIEKYQDKIEKYERKIEDTREEVGDELQTAEQKATRITELEAELRKLEASRRNYLG